MPSAASDPSIGDDLPAYAKDSVYLQLGEKRDLRSITPEWAWGGSTGRGVRVAVVDSGVDADHPLVADCVDVENGIAINVDADGGTQEERGEHNDRMGHGTACAGIIHEMAPDARITSVRVLNNMFGGKAAAFVRGLAWSIEQRFDVVNMSLGASKLEWALPFYELCDEAFHAGVVLVTAANNLSTPSFPSMYGSVISVASHTGSDSWRYHHNTTPPPEFLARGLDVPVAWRRGETVTMTGNSFASPRIAGLVALIRAKHPSLRPYEIKTVLAAAASNVVEAGGSRRRPKQYQSIHLSRLPRE